jgi:hypothetical protein
MAKLGVLTQIQEGTTRFLCYRTYFSRTIRIFAVLLEEKTRKDVQTAFRNAEGTKPRRL